MKRTLSFMLALVLLVGLMPMQAFAAEVDSETQRTEPTVVMEEHTHSYENGTCAVCGTTTSPYLQQLPENITGCSNLYNILTPAKGYYTATKYDTSNGAVLSVVIPVEPGDRIAASSFGSVAENMGSVDGIRVTYLLDGTIVESLSASSVHTTYTQDGYLTVPTGVNMVSVPWWKPMDGNWLTLSQISKNFASHNPISVSAKAPTCTESGYTAGEVCEICDALLGSREEIPASGHDYNGNICTTCETVNIPAILNGKYVSILGDSISTFNGYSNDATVNATIGGNGPRYDIGTADTKPGSYCLLESVNDTWWMHFANRSGMRLLVNNSWAGSQVFGSKTSDGRVIPAAHLERCVNLHDNTVENNPNNAPINPDVIFVYIGINDYNFNRSNVGNGAVDYAALINSDGTYITPTTFGEAYGILLHKMQHTYPNAQIFVMTLLPENLYSVDRTAWEQHNVYIRAAAEYYDIPVVDLAENCAITWDNYSGYMIDKIHPTTAGMELISDCIEAELVAYYTENPSHTHSYVNSVCSVCGHTNGPVITKQPVDVTVKQGETAKVTVKATGDGLTYKWYYANKGSTKFTLTNSFKGNSYYVTMNSTRAGRRIYCVITDKHGNSVTTDIVTLGMETQLEIVKQPVDVLVSSGEQARLTVKATGDGLTYKWYYANKGSTKFTLTNSFKGSAYYVTMNSARAGRRVYCVITDKYGNSVQTDTVTLRSKVSIITQPSDAFAANGEKATVSVKAIGEGLTYKWYYANEGSTKFTSTNSFKGSSYYVTMNEIRDGRQIYCVITDRYGNQVTTSVVTLHAKK